MLAPSAHTGQHGGSNLIGCGGALDLPYRFRDDLIDCIFGCSSSLKCLDRSLRSRSKRITAASGLTGLRFDCIGIVASCASSE